ncbi:hypothetical protein [Streptomyces sp. NPDC054797]
MTGPVNRSALAAVTGLDEGDSADLGWMDRLDANLRGAGHGPDHTFMLSTLRLIVSRPPPAAARIRLPRRAGPRGAAGRRPARHGPTLLWEALASCPQEAFVPSITAANEWAMDVGLAAGLDIVQEGYVAVRDMTVPGPYLTGGHFL